jgi:hypothetical protein
LLQFPYPKQDAEWAGVVYLQLTTVPPAPRWSTVPGLRWHYHLNSAQAKLLGTILVCPDSSAPCTQYITETFLHYSYFSNLLFPFPLPLLLCSGTWHFSCLDCWKHIQFFFSVLMTEFRTLCLLGRCSTA